MGATSPTGRLDMPVLEELSMGGVHFRESYVVPYPQAPLPPKLRYLTLTDYDSQNIPFSVFDFVTALITCKNLFRLHLKNLRLDISDTGTSSPRQPPWNYNFGFNLDFTDMSGDVIAELNRLLQYVLADSASYTCCSMPIRNTFPLWCVCDAFRVSFVDIASPMVLVNLLAGEASYREVLISRSDGLQSEVLHALTTPMATEHGGVDWPCPHLRELHINSCKQFSSKDLRDMLEARLKAHEETEFAMEDDGADFVLRSVTELYVHDCGELAPDDKEWFDKNVERVQWDDWRGGTEWP
ncbi:uncharacterized protein B0H18DRAFT_1175263 [Fomitopsis serialis]|uniref:uncharacterized protein n=1 Tax=Fomitopsis serialis TaxID=139415 RepID=UPI0020079673|nr:uncharacterized protein B0H18DRAFT_1175263 [Neoantrodia serialis]KAH9924553.1 hypothetical protein B0H18DRAFT_1175263 [Neoantrodia serialis]